jgi:trigger factor
VAGKTADFMVTVKKIEAAHLPEVNEQLAKSLGIADATVEGLRADIRKNLEREVKFRLLARNKQAVMDALVAKAELDLPNASVQSEVDRMIENARADLKQRGIKDADKAPIPRTCSARRPSAACAWAWWWPSWCVPTNCRPSPSRSRPISTSWPPATKSRPTWCAGTTRQPRLAEVEAIVIENNVTERAVQGQDHRQGHLV